LSHSRTSPKLGLVLGSGASRGWSHIGIIKALVKEGIVPDIVCGTSVGAMIGASYLTGNLENLEHWVLGSSKTDVLRFFNIKLSQSGFVDNDRMNWFLHKYVSGPNTLIEDLPKRFATVATNLDNGREVWFQKGGLTEAVRASMALPGLFPAVRSEHRWLVDGGLVNPVPVSTCRALGADVVIAVNLNSDIIGKRNHKKPEKKAGPEPVPNGDKDNGTREIKTVLRNLKQSTVDYSNSLFADNDKENDIPGLFYAVTKSINIAQDRITRSRLAGDPAEIVLSPKLARIGMLEFHRAQEAISEGERCVTAAMTDIHRAIADA
jgi:NTE family protein